MKFVAVFLALFALNAQAALQVAPKLPVASSVSHQWINSISAGGVVTQTQPAFTDISGTATASQLPTATNAAIGGVQIITSATSHQWVSSWNSSGVPQTTQPAFSDISSTATPAQIIVASNNQTAAYNVASTDLIIKFSGLSADVTATLPSAATSGQHYYIVNADTTHKVTINTTSSQTVGGRSSGDIVLAAGYNDFLEVFADGSNYQITGKKETKVLTSTGSHTTGAAPSNVYTSGSASVTLTYGIWRVTCWVGTSMGSAGTTNFGQLGGGIFGADGANNNSAPTALSGTISGSIGFSPSTIQIPTNGTAAAIMGPGIATILDSVTSNTSAFCVPQVSASSGTQGTSSQIFAERIW